MFNRLDLAQPLNKGPEAKEEIMVVGYTYLVSPEFSPDNVPEGYT